MTKPPKKIVKTVEMRIRKVPMDIHSSIVIHQKIMTKNKEEGISLDEAAIEVWRLGLAALSK